MDECEHQKNRSDIANQLLQELYTYKFKEVYEKRIGWRVSIIMLSFA